MQSFKNRLSSLKNKGLLAIHISTFLFGIAGIFGKIIDLHPIIIVLGRVFFASIFLGALLIIKKESIKLKKNKDYLSFFYLGILLAFHWVTFFQAIQISTVAVGLLTFSTFPVFTAFIEPLFFKEKINLLNIILAIITFFGIALIIPNFELDNNITQGAIYGIASGLSFAIISVLNRKYVKQYSSLTIAFYQDFFACLILIPFVFFINFDSKTTDILLLILLGIVFTAVAHTLFINGLKTVKAQIASIIATLEPVYGIILAFILLDEGPTIRIILGGMIIFGTTFYATYKNQQH